MQESRGFKVAARGDREIAGSREFDAPRELVWEAFTRPELVRRWLLGPDGWNMTVCDIDLRVGGTYRYVWVHAQSNQTMGMGGTFLEIEKPARLVSTEKFEQAWYPGEMVGTVEFVEKDGKTTVHQNFRYDSRETRDAVLKTPMEAGMAAGYRRLDGVLAELSARGAAGRGRA